MLIYKLLRAAEWSELEAAGTTAGAPVDLTDGYIHFSTSTQVKETARLYFARQDDLVLVAVDAGRLGEALRYEASRGGDLFPHLFAPLPLSTVLWVRPLPLGPDGRHIFPDELP